MYIKIKQIALHIDPIKPPDFVDVLKWVNQRHAVVLKIIVIELVPKVKPQITTLSHKYICHEFSRLILKFRPTACSSFFVVVKTKSTRIFSHDTFR